MDKMVLSKEEEEDIDNIVVEIKRKYHNIDEKDVRDCLIYYIHFTHNIYSLRDLFEFVSLYIDNQQHS